MRYPNRAAAPTALRTKSELQRAGRNPVNGQAPVAHYWQGHAWTALYDSAPTVPMRSACAPSEELAAGRVPARTCQICGTRTAIDWLDRRGVRAACRADIARQEREDAACGLPFTANAWLAADPLFLDTETTGLDARRRSSRSRFSIAPARPTGRASDRRWPSCIRRFLPRADRPRRRAEPERRDDARQLLRSHGHPCGTRAGAGAPH